MGKVPKIRTRGERVCAFIEAHCIVPEGKLVGHRMKLAPFQVRFILEVYDNPAGTRRAYLSIGRKNAKTALIAALLLAHLVGPEARLNSELASGARSKKQAAQVFRYASKMASMSPTLCDLVKATPSQKILVGLPRNVTYNALAAEASTEIGGSPVLAIIDEIGQIKGPLDDFVDAMETSQGAHDDPLLIAISTQARNDTDMFSLWLDDALDEDGNQKDPRIVCHLYTAPDGCELDDPAAWEAANPAIDLFRSRQDVIDQAKLALRMPSKENTFRNLTLNQRVSTASPYVSKIVWKENGRAPPLMIDPDRDVFGGLDLSARFDLTALVLIQELADLPGVWGVWAFFWTPLEALAERARRDKVGYEQWVADGFLRTTPGKSVDYDHVAEEIAEIVEGLKLVHIAYDRWRMDVMIKAIDRLEGGPVIPLVPFGQGFKDMAPALDDLEADLLNARIAHGMNPVMTMCAAGAVVTMNTTGDRKLDKSKASGRIDGMVALAMARGAATKAPLEEPSVYLTRGVLSVEV